MGVMRDPAFVDVAVPCFWAIFLMKGRSDRLHVSSSFISPHCLPCLLHLSVLLRGDSSLIVTSRRQKSSCKLNYQSYPPPGIEHSATEKQVLLRQFSSEAFEPRFFVPCQHDVSFGGADPKNLVFPLRAYEPA